MTASVMKGRSLTAAAQLLHGKTIDRNGMRQSVSRKSAGASWQQAAWDYYDLIGEYAMGVDMLAWAVSQVRIVSAKEAPGDVEPEIVTGELDPDTNEQRFESRADEIAAEIASQFAGGAIGQQQLIQRTVTQLIVAAESFIVGRAMPDGEDDVWEAYSRDEVKYRAGGWVIDDGVDKFALGENDVLIRVWIPSARRRQQPRSSSKSLLPILAEIDSLTKSIQAQNDSRLAGAGIIIWPDSVELIGGSSEHDPDEGDPFILDVSDMMITPLTNRESASAVVPIMVKVPVEAVGKVQWLVKPAIASPKDAEDRETAIKRMARAMDLPPEQITGTGEANHWGAWMIAEDTIKGPVTSYASIFVHAVTQVWYRAALETAYAAEGIDVAEAEGRMLWFDTTKLEQRPDRTEQAVFAFDRGGLNFEGFLRELGLDPSDVPEGPEIVRILLFMLAKADPAAAVKLLTDPELFDRIVETAKPVDEIEPPADEDEPDPTQEDTRSLPQQPTRDQVPAA